MKYAEEIIKEIKNRGTIDADDYLIDDSWEDYIRGKGSMTREEIIDGLELIKQLGYEGCQNCQHQIEPLRSCEWAEQGGDGHIHIICPKWDKRGGEV